MVCSKWQTPQHAVVLASDEVHVWLSSLSVAAASLERFWQTLSADEKERAKRFVFQKDRDHFIAARGTLRAILGYYLDTQAEQLRFCYSNYGKPALCRELSGTKICFNVSHSNELGLFAVTRAREIGVDIEHIRPDFATTEIADRFFSSNEIEALRQLPENEQIEGFFNCWVRKEAYIKADGKGLSIPLNEFDVSIESDHPEVRLRSQSNPREASRWRLHHLSPADDYAAAVAVEGKEWKLECWRWMESSYLF
ncbi:MAG TPA: 4'-phosphopantetheinyl transferase superfamily protein [Blastocatellia bacterium]|nr:4'-phosphopantetheinyl transferase superfamily protein [Blastocatellia bacterium]